MFSTLEPKQYIILLFVLFLDPNVLKLSMSPDGPEIFGGEEGEQSVV